MTQKDMRDEKIHGMDCDMLADLSALDEYWKAAVEFVTEYQNHGPESMSTKQRAWLEKIQDSYEAVHLKNFL